MNLDETDNLDVETVEEFAEDHGIYMIDDPELLELEAIIFEN